MVSNTLLVLGFGMIVCARTLQEVPSNCPASISKGKLGLTFRCEIFKKEISIFRFELEYYAVLFI